jgi:hypothetical protein
MPEFPAVRRRLVVFLPGFEAMPAIAHARRFVREARRTAPVYAMVLPGEVAVSREGEVTARIVAAGAGDAATETELLVDSMDEIAASYAARGAMRRLATGYRALFDFAISGAAPRFAATSWRYLIFFLFPLILPLAAVLLALLAWQVSASAATGLLVGVVLAVAFAWIAFSRLHLLLVMDDWTFAHDLAHRRQPDFEAALDRLAAWTANRASEGQFDEIVIAAHSLGAIAAVPLARRIVRMWAPLPPVGLLTVGSSLLKVALHPKADWLRDDVEAVSEERISWLDVQALTDPIHFYKSHPLTSLGLADVGSVRTMRVRFRNQLDPDRYRRLKFNLFAVHRQFVGGVDRPTDYAFHAILLGPERFETIAARPGLAPGRAATEGAGRA